MDLGDDEPGATRPAEDELAPSGAPVAPQQPEWPAARSSRSGRARGDGPPPAWRAPRRPPRWPRGPWPTALVWAVLGVSALVLIGLTAGAVGFPWLVWLWGFIPLAWGGVAILLVGTDRAGQLRLLSFLAMVTAAGVLLGNAIDGSVLSLRGVAVTAAVSDVSHYTQRGGAAVYELSLAEPDGTPVPGGTLNDADPTGPYRVGDRLAVVYDPDGVVAPELPSDVHPAGGLFGAAGGVTLLLFGCLGWWARHPPRPRRPRRKRPVGVSRR